MWHNEYEYKARPKIKEVPIIDNTENYNRLMRIVDKRNKTWVNPNPKRSKSKEPDIDFSGIDIMPSGISRWQEFFNEYKSWARQQNIGSLNALGYVINYGFHLGNISSYQIADITNVFNDFSIKMFTHKIKIECRNAPLVEMEQHYMRFNEGEDILLDITLFIDKNNHYFVEGVRGLNWGRRRGHSQGKQDPAYLLDILEPIFRTYHDFDED